MFDELQRAAGRGRDDRKAGGLSLDKCNAEWLRIHVRLAINIGRVQQRLDVNSMPGEAHPAR
jgi:hypothetical protein